VSIKDILLNREYEYIPMFSIKNLRNKVVIDAGAHVGLYSLIAATYAKKVISIEPHPVNYRLLEINKIINNAGNLVPVNVAIVGTRTEANHIYLYESTHSATATIMTPAPRRYKVRVKTLDDIVEEYTEQGDTIWLKMDIEGAEFDVFKHASMSLLKRITFIVGEIHLKHGSIDSILKKLKSAGFCTEYLHPPLAARNARPCIRVQDMLKLKVLRSIIYSLASACKVKLRNLAILFAWRNDNQELEKR